MRCICLIGVVPLALGCGGGDSSGMTVDAQIDAPANNTCLIPASYGDLGAKVGSTILSLDSVSIQLDAGPPRDQLLINIEPGKGVFAGGVKTGTYSLADETQLGNCGLCVSIAADVIAGQGPTKFYFADTGTVVLDSTTPPEGSIQNVMLSEVMVDGTPVPGCSTTITAMTFTAQ